MTRWRSHCVKTAETERPALYQPIWISPGRERTGNGEKKAASPGAMLFQGLLDPFQDLGNGGGIAGKLGLRLGSVVLNVTRDGRSENPLAALQTVRHINDPALVRTLVSPASPRPPADAHDPLAVCDGLVLRRRNIEVVNLQ